MDEEKPMCERVAPSPPRAELAMACLPRAAGRARRSRLLGFFLVPVFLLSGCGPTERSAVRSNDGGGDEGDGPPADLDAGVRVDADEAVGDPSDADPSDADPSDADPSDADASELVLPSPPLVGLVHTAEQLEHVRERRGEEPWASAIAQVLSEADAALGRSPSPVGDFEVPMYYDDPDGHEAMKRHLTDDGFAAYALALAYQLAGSAEDRDRYASHAVEILQAWATVNYRTSGPDGALVMLYRGVHLVYAADLVGGYAGAEPSWLEAFRSWVDRVLREASLEEKHDRNNPGDWGTLGAVVTAAFLGERDDVALEADRIRDRADRNIDADGELPLENLRTNSGIWYTYFALTAMTAAMHVVRNAIGVDLLDPGSSSGRAIGRALDSLYHYSLFPEDWPYELPGGIAGWLHRLVYPCADELEVGSPSGWPGNLFEIMSAELDEPEWAAWVEPHRPIRGWHGWIYPTLMRP